MAKIPTLKGFLAEDFKEAPAWFHQLLTPLNEYMSTMANALNGRLTRTENLLAYTDPFDFTTAAAAADTFPLRFKNKLLGGAKPTDVHLGQFHRFDGAAPAAAFSMSWQINDLGEIEIRLQGLENAVRYTGNLSVSA